MRSRAKLKMIEKADEKDAPRRGASSLMLRAPRWIRVDRLWNERGREAAPAEQGCLLPTAENHRGTHWRCGRSDSAAAARRAFLRCLPRAPSHRAAARL